ARSVSRREIRGVRGRRSVDVRLGRHRGDIGQAVPPGARASAASSRTLPGSCCANGRRPGAEAAERAWSRPVARTVSVSNTPPACPTPDTGATSTCTRGYNPVVFTLKVLFLQGGAHRDGAGPPRAGPFFT